MSYNIAIVNFTLPENFEEACEIVNPMSDISVDEVDESYMRFYEKVTEIYPCLCSLPDDEIDNSVWCDGPLINNFKVKAPVVGNLALDMGLSILDWQTEAVYNP